MVDLVASSLLSSAAVAEHLPVSNRLVRLYWCKHDYTQFEREATEDLVSSYGNFFFPIRFLGLGFWSEPLWAPLSNCVMICFFLLLWG